MAELHEYQSRSTAATTLAASIAERLRGAIAQRGEASLVVCGGRSPVELFHALAAESLDWQRVTVVPSDERWVATDHADSNEAMIRRELLSGPAANARLVGLYRDTATPAEAIDDVSAALREVPQPLDVVLLGMGEDGHTASLFPHDPAIETKVEMTEPCLVAEVGPPRRLSLSLPYLCDARSIDIFIFGDDKRRVFKAAEQAGPVAQYPVRGVLRHAEPIAQAHWAP